MVMINLSKINTVNDFDDIEQYSKKNPLNQPPQYPTTTPLMMSRVESPAKSMENDTLNELEKKDWAL